MAEIEHFCDPLDKRHPKFKTVRNTKMLLYSACNQMDGKSAEFKTVGEAVDAVSNYNPYKGMVATELLFLECEINFLIQSIKLYTFI